MIYYQDDEMLIRDLQDQDVVSLFHWWTDKEINKYDPKPQPRNSKELLAECARYCDCFDLEKMNSNVEARKYRYFVITDTEDNPIGFVNFFGVDAERKQGEMGVVIGDKRYWKRGVASKAVRIAVEHIFSYMPIARIFIETSETNIPALGLFRKLAFKVCGEYIEDDGFRFIVMERCKS